MPDFKKAMIYKLYKVIWENDLPPKIMMYVGSTSNFINRKYLHKIDSETKTSLLYKTIRENGGFDAWTMEKIKDFPCDNKIQLLIEEDKCIKALGGNLNVKRAYLTDEEARLKNLERMNHKYKNDPEFRKKVIERLKHKYHNDEAYKADQLQKMNNRYANDAIYRANTIYRSKQRYAQKQVSVPS